MLQKWLKIHEIINWNAPLLEFSTIFVVEKVKQLFMDYCKSLNILYLYQQIHILTGWISFKCSLLFNIVKKTRKFTEFDRK